MAAPRLLILGAAMGNLPRIRAARAAGFHCIVADDLPQPHGFAAADATLRAAPGDLTALRHGIRALGGVDGIVGTNEIGALSAAKLGREMGHPGAADPVVIAQGLSKQAQREAWAAGAPEWSVPFALVPDPAALPAVMGRIGFPAVLKPSLSAGGSRGVSLVEEPADLAAAYSFAAEGGLPGSIVLVEAALSGPQYSCEVILRDGTALVVAVGRKVKSPPPYRVDLAICYDAAAAALRPEVARMVEALCAALGLRDGSTHVEFAETPNGLRPIELAMRSGGGLTPDLAAAVGGVDPFLAECYRACALPLPLPPVDTSPRATACFRFLLFPPGQAASVDVPEEVRMHPGVLAAQVFLPESNIIEPLRWTSQRCGLLGVVAPPGEDVASLAEALAGRISITYADGHRNAALPLQVSGQQEQE